MANGGRGGFTWWRGWEGRWWNFSRLILRFFFNHRFNVESKIFQKFETIFSSRFRTTGRGGRKEGEVRYLILSPFSAPDVELECLATWKESSTHNLVARLHAPRKTSDEDSYRCFIYEQTSNNSWNLAQSEDASCTGLISVKEAAKTFKMKQSE